jgi:hypothetical protein
VGFGLLLPVSPIAGWFASSTAGRYFLFLVPAVLTYLVLVEVAKRRLLRRAL